MMISRKLILQNDVQQVPLLAEVVGEVCSAVGLDETATKLVNLAVEEAVVNVMCYAYPPGTVADIHIEAEADDEWMRFTITDSGVPFDPTTHGEVDTTLSADERAIGGLGIYLMRTSMDDMSYQRRGNENVLTLSKRINNKHQNN